MRIVSHQCAYGEIRLSAIRKLAARTSNAVQSTGVALAALSGDVDAEIARAQAWVADTESAFEKARTELGVIGLTGSESDISKASDDYRRARERLIAAKEALQAAQKRKADRLAADADEARRARRDRLRGALGYLHSVAVGADGAPGVAQLTEALVAKVQAFNTASDDVRALDNSFANELTDARNAMLNYIADAIGFKKSPADPAVLAAWAARLPTPDRVSP